MGTTVVFLPVFSMFTSLFIPFSGRKSVIQLRVIMLSIPVSVTFSASLFHQYFTGLPFFEKTGEYESFLCWPNSD